MHTVTNRMEKELGNRIVLSRGMKCVTFKDQSGDTVGKIVRDVRTDKPILVGKILNSGPRIVEMEYDK